MPQRKNRRKKTERKESARIAPSFSANLYKTIIAMFLLVAIIMGVALLFHSWLPTTKEKPPSAPATVKKPEPTPPKAIAPIFEIYTPEARHPIYPPRTSSPPSDRRPKVAIIVDDLGYDSHMLKKFIELNAPLTLSVLPHCPLRQTIARSARQKGLEIMLHLPMEPIEYPTVNPGPGALLVSMSPDILIQQLESDLNSVPDVKGVNNHMGSRMTTISTQMYQIFSILKKRDLYFIDSRTTKDSLCKPAARLLRMKFAERDVFLDHTLEPETIRGQIKRLIQVAFEKGHAIGICHPHEATYRVLLKELPGVVEKVAIVPASELVYPVSVSDSPLDPG